MTLLWRGLLRLFLFLCLYGCSKSNQVFPYQDISVNYFDTLRNKSYVINPKSVSRLIDSLRLAAGDTTFVDLYVDRYYANRSGYIWIDMRGVDSRVDTLASLISDVESDAVKSTSVFLPQINGALRRIRNLDFSGGHDINLTLAELEYFSTKALARYAAGMRFGFINPRKYMNSLEKEDTDDTLNNKFRTLYGIKSPVCNKKFLDTIFASASDGSFANIVRQMLPKNKNYARLRKEYARKDLTSHQRRALAANMERFRWVYGEEKRKYVWINIPEYLLRAENEATGETLQMRVCVGRTKYKTPLLTSEIKRLDLNPEWAIPLSIIRREIAASHAEDEEYFERNQMKVIEKETGEEIPPTDIDAEMLKSGKFRVVQQKGDGNSLGRIIFRFDNDFAIYLHDTPNRAAFTQSRRTVSHGCIRVEKPLELAMFLLEEKNPEEIDKIRIAIDLPPVTEKGITLAQKENYEHIKAKTLQPAVPIYITYYTAYPDKSGRIVYTPDPYGYDAPMCRLLNSY